MTISSVITSKQATANGSTLQFPFPNKIFSASDLVVTLIDLVGNLYLFTGGPTTWSNATTGLSYTVQNVDVDTGCMITMSAAVTTGWIVDIRSNTPETQSTSVKNQGQFLPELHEEAFDRLTRMDQDLYRLTYLYGIHGPDIESAPWPALPAPSGRKGQSLMFDPITGLPTLGIPNTQTITSGLLAPFLGLQETAAETAALVTIVNIFYPPGNVLRYGNNTIPGTTDMTTAIQAAINQWSQGGARVYVPAGTYFHASSLTIPATTSGRGAAAAFGFSIRGDGQGMSVITTSGNIENFSTTGATASTFLYQPTFEDLEVANTYAPSGSPQVGCTFHNIHLQNPQNARIIRCHLRGAFTDVVGVAANHAGVWFDNQGYAGTYLNEVVDSWIDHAHVTCDTSDSIVRDNFIWGNGCDYAVKVNNANVTVSNNFDINGLTSNSGHGAVWLTTNASNAKVLNNFFDADCTYGVWSDGNLMQLIQGNIFWENLQSAIHMVNANFVSIMGNLFLNCGTNNGGLLCSDIIFDTQSFCDFCTVIGNVHYRTGATTNAYGIYEYVNGASPTQNRYIGNVYADASGTQYNTPAILITVTLRNGTPGSHSLANVGKGTETELYGSFTGTFTGGTTAPTVTINWTRNQNTVTMTIPFAFYTSNSTGFTVTGIPASLQPAFTQAMPCNVEDNNTPQLGICSITNGSNAFTFTLGNGGAWTATGNRALYSTLNFTYQLV